MINSLSLSLSLFLSLSHSFPPSLLLPLFFLSLSLPPFPPPPSRRKLYWSDVANDVIMEANLDGTNIRMLVKQGLEEPGMATCT